MTLVRHTLTLLLCGLMAACGNDNPADKNGPAAKKQQLDKLMSEKAKLDEEISRLRSEIEASDSSGTAQARLVAVTPVAQDTFRHFLDLRGKVDAEQISYITPRGMGGQVKALYIKEGDRVRKGQLLLKLDDALMRQSLTAARQQLEGLKTQLTYARDLAERQNNLWQKGIGTEVQLITARTNVKTLENQLKASEEQVKVAQEQVNMAQVYSDVDGVAETVMVKVGELFSGMGQIKIVNTSRLKVTTIVPENYISRVKIGTPVQIDIPEMGKSFRSKVTLVGQTIEPTQRGFVAEAAIPSDAQLKPNQSVVVKIRDYTSNQAVIIPINSLQSDEKGKFVYIMDKNTAGRTVALRRTITLGESYGDMTEVLSGLSGGEQLITSGYQNLYDGQQVYTAQP